MAKSLFERRRSLRLTRSDVAAMTGLSSQTVRNYELNRGNYVAQKYQRLISLYDRLERKAEMAEESKNGGI